MKLSNTNSLRFRFIATLTLYCFVLQIIYPLFVSNNAYGQNGPGQSENLGLSLNSTGHLVNEFTGDFSYSIPLMSVEGYPITISYNQNVSMDTEASWVGLGWNLNIGAISRDKRGIPDDFNGDDLIKRTFNVQDNKTFDGFKIGVNSSIGLVSSIPIVPGIGFNGGGVSLLAGKYNNTYNGNGYTMDFGLAGSFSVNNLINAGLNLGIGFNLDTQNGIGRSSTVGISGIKPVRGLSLNYTGNFNSRTGKDSRIFSLGYSRESQLLGSGKISTSFGSIQSLGSLTTTPRVEFPFRSESDATQIELAKFIITGNFKKETSLVTVSYDSESKLKFKTLNQNAYGYLHYGKRETINNTSQYPVMDYNYGRASEISENMKSLPFAVPTYDMFSFSAAGFQGQFRAQRHDVGTLKGASVVSSASGNSNTFSVGGGAIVGSIFGVKIGYTNGTQSGEQNSGEWTINDNETFTYEGNNSKKEFDESIFFKTVGEKTVTNMNTYNTLIGDNLLQREPIDLGQGSVSLTNQFYGNQLNLSNLNLASNGDNEIRATEYLMLTAEQRKAASNSQIKSKVKNTSYDSNTNLENRITTLKKAHHLSSTEIISPDGMRYVYDIPVYNTKQEEVMFGVAGLKEAHSNIFENEGLIPYSAGVDNSIFNTRGKTHFFDKTEIPGYAHSFLLTEILTPDYIDVDNNGPSANDIGNYYKFNYSKLYDESSPYTWRKPYSGAPGGSPKAYLNDNFRATEQDDIANYTYGEKELYLVHSIESKNMVAEFIISPRFDAYGQDENGFIKENMPGYQLDKIVLYNKNERRDNPNAVPLQVVEFEYDYSLCKNFPLNTNTHNGNFDKSGKLTLKKIRIRNKNSEEKTLAPYEFSYGTIDPTLPNDPWNTEYSTLNIDRWGNFKENDPNYPNYYYPYADQDVLKANKSANNWKLQEIITPENGKILIDYEADEYSFVQDKRVMSHYSVLGMVSPLKLAFLMGQNFATQIPDVHHNLRTSSFEYNQLSNQVVQLNNTYSEKEINGFIFGQTSKKGGNNLHQELPNNVLIFELDEAYTYDPSTSTKEVLEQEFAKDYLTDEKGNRLTEIFCKTRVKIDPNEDKYEIIPTFAPISNKIPSEYQKVFNELSLPSIKSFGLLGNGSEFKYGYVILELDGVKDAIFDRSGNLKYPNSSYFVNPIQKTAMEFSRRHLPELVYADCEGNDCDYKLNLDVTVVMGGDVNKKMNKEEFCLSFDSSETFVRMFTQKRRKYSSEARVSAITYIDNWSEMTASNEEESTYRWEYKYNETLIATYNGVAAYEPQIGNDENPFYQWTRYTNIVKSFPDDNMFTPEPFAELLFPAPTIGYEEVEVSFNNPNQFNNTGKSYSRFHTAKEFPTVIRRTEIQKETSEVPIFSLFNYKKSVALTQGFFVGTNDFHGQPKESEIIDAMGNRQSKTKYNYRGLDNQVTTLNRQAEQQTETIATEYDIYAQTNFSNRMSKSFRIGADVYLGFIPAPPFLSYFNLSPDVGIVNSEEGIYSNTFNKIINRSAIVESIETEYLGSHNSAKNIAYDRFSGNVIVSSLKDEYNDELFSMSYPAHWKFDNFRNYNRTHKTITNVQLNNFEFSDPDQVFTEGDIVYLSLTGSTDGGFAQVLKVFPSTGTAWLMLPNGSLLNTEGANVNIDITLVKTIRKNQLNRVMQSKTTKDDSFISQPIMNPNDNIISISVVDFKEGGKIPCEKRLEEVPLQAYDVGSVINPYQYGLKGIYRVANSFALQTGRTNFDNNLGTRFDGIIDSYVPYYDLNVDLNDGDKWKRINESGHPNYPTTTVPANFDYYQGYRKLGDINKFDEFGKVIEVVDQVDVKSSVLFGYNNDLKLMPTAQAVNAQQNQLVFDGFEDYSYIPENVVFPLVSYPHFNFNQTSSQLTSIERHSGKTSLVVSPNSNVSSSRAIEVSANIGKCDDSIVIVDGDGEASEGQTSEGFAGHVSRTGSGFVLQDCDCLTGFNPVEGKYVVSVWVKLQSAELETTYTSPIVNVSTNGVLLTSIIPSGNIIDGWQKAEGVISIGSSDTEITIELANTDQTRDAYFDDFRIHPYNAAMTTVVYDPKTLLPLATHDSYNFTTFYNYDENYDLVSIRVETIDGIKTISATDRGFVKKHNN